MNIYDPITMGRTQKKDDRENKIRPYITSLLLLVIAEGETHVKILLQNPPAAIQQKKSGEDKTIDQVNWTY